jgi:uncharacterized repeat protein (TIGR01451 family)
MLFVSTFVLGAWVAPAVVAADPNYEAPRLEAAEAFHTPWYTPTPTTAEARNTFGPRRARPAGLLGVPFAAAFAPLITVTKTDQLLVDTDGDGLADPGDTIRYTIEIANALGAMDATGVGFVDTFDAHTSLVAGSENASPLAYDGTTSVSGSPVTITLTGTDGDGDALTFSITTGPTEGALSALTQITPTTAGVTYTQTNPNASSDSFTFNVNDGAVDSNEDATILISLGNPAPVVTLTDTTPLTYTEGDVALQITSDLTVGDNSAIASATVSISAGFEASQDVLAATASGAIAAGDISYDSGTGVLTIAPGAPASTADFETVLRSVTYENTSMNPTKASSKAVAVQAIRRRPAWLSSRVIGRSSLSSTMGMWIRTPARRPSR